MPSLTSWNRLEPRTRNETLPGLAARVHDPLWMLTRQWQFGEFRAEDAGSPISVRVRGERAELTTYTAGGVSSPLSARSPLDAMVEREAPRTDGPERITAGLHFMRLLGSALALKTRAWYAQNFPLDPIVDPDATSADPPLPVARLVPDGAKLQEALSAGNLVTVPPNLTASESDQVNDALETFRKWYPSVYTQAASTAWRADSLRYRFSATAPLATAAGGSGQTALLASSTGAHLDWYTFDAGAVTSAAAAATPLDISALPTPARFAGMPSARWWEFEEGTVDFGALDTAPEDLGRLLLAEFALVYGNDFFVVPIDLPIGTLCRLTSIDVANNFGETLTIRASAATAAGSWRLFQLSKDQAAAALGAATDLFLLPPVAAAGLEGPELEEVSFMRDEMANVAWAVERVVAGPAGIIHRNERENFDPNVQAPAPSALASGAAPVFEYRLATSVPGNWYPLVPTRLAGNTGANARSVALQLTNASLTGKILGANELGAAPLNEEELPRSGVLVTRKWKYARWLDGSSHLWIGRTRSVGRGEGSSGLRFDFIVSGSP